MAALLLASGVRTHLRNWDWENEEVLFRAAQKVRHANADVHWDYVGLTISKA